MVHPLRSDQFSLCILKMFMLGWKLFSLRFILFYIVGIQPLIRWLQRFSCSNRFSTKTNNLCRDIRYMHSTDSFWKIEIFEMNRNRLKAFFFDMLIWILSDLEPKTCLLKSFFKTTHPCLPAALASFLSRYHDI